MSRGFIVEVTDLSTEKERRKYALLAAAAVIYAKGTNGGYNNCVNAAYNLLEIVEGLERGRQCPE